MGNKWRGEGALLLKLFSLFIVVKLCPPAYIFLNFTPKKLFSSCQGGSSTG